MKKLWEKFEVTTLFGIMVIGAVYLLFILSAPLFWALDLYRHVRYSSRWDRFVAWLNESPDLPHGRV